MYKLLKKVKFVPGASRRVVLPDFTCDHIEKIFGARTAKKSQQKNKYSDNLVIVNDATDEIFTLYMMQGEWRIGGTSDRFPSSKMISLQNLAGYRMKDVAAFEKWLREKAGL